MAESHKVIALISGGKDSIYSILHCLENGHKVVALGNLYSSHSDTEPEHDLNSFMYQTVGQTVIPLYEQALGIPLYRHPIVGTALQTGTSYAPTDGDDETEALMPLLVTILAAHPDADALSSGAILSTYQRTRIESVAQRLGLVPLSYLWQYPVLAPGAQAALLTDMAAAGLEARIVKVASGGLDESSLWENVACQNGIRRVEKALLRFAPGGDGAAVLGEGGEFETLVLDGPVDFFRGRIVVDEEDRRVVREGGGTAWLRMERARFEAKPVHSAAIRTRPRKPELLAPRFRETLEDLQSKVTALDFLGTGGSSDYQTCIDGSSGYQTLQPLSATASIKSSTHAEPSQAWTICARKPYPDGLIELEMEDIVEQLSFSLQDRGAQLSDVISIFIYLRSMKDFSAINKIYGAFFSEINPPTRVTVACGDLLPSGYNVVIHASFSAKPYRSTSRKALHVQSRSYWAPANIGPYSQAQAVLEASLSPDIALWTVHIAGQIPLVPSTMELPSCFHTAGDTRADASKEFSEYNLQTVLSLQHTWRVGVEMDVAWWSGAVAYLAQDTKARITVKARLAGAAWERQHLASRQECADDSEEERDPWKERYYDDFNSWIGRKATKELPDWSVVDNQVDNGIFVPFFFAAEVAELPRGAEIEWQAFAGFVKCPIKLISCRTTEGNAIQRCIAGDSLTYTMVMLPFRLEIHDISGIIEDLVTTTKRFHTPTSTRAIGASYASYFDAGVKGLWGLSEYRGVIPCRSLWDVFGNRLAAVLLFRS